MAQNEIPAEAIPDLVARAPTTPGCYLWKDARERVLYVGKAVNLRARLRNYLRPEHERTAALMVQAENLEWITTETGSEALVLEANLIKKHKPRYNVQLKDDKRYPYICVSTGEPYPRVFITRTIRDDGHRYVGPYTDVRATRNTLSLIHKIFPIRKTPLKLPLKKPQRPCMNFHIKRCLGPCRGNVPQEEYAKLVDEILLFLEGRREILENIITTRMGEYSQVMDYERAAIYRDMLSNIRRATERQSVMSPAGGDEDIIAFARRDDHGQIVLMEVRDGRLLGRKSFPLVGVQDAPEPEILTSFLRDYYLNAEFIPARIITPVVIKDKRELLEYIRERTDRTVRITTTAKPEQKAMLRMAGKNAELLMSERLLAVRLRDRKGALEELKNMLKLPEEPQVIECYDISHFQGSQPVASGVMFVDGHPKPSGYRHYNMKTVKGINDPAMIQEAVARRIQRLRNEDKALPDLMVIDGGSTQLKAACEAAAALDAGDLPIIGLAKQREELYFPGDESPHGFDPDSPAMRLLRHLRDEAHRFGITHHRKKRNRATMKHVVEQIPDIGPERRKALLKHFTDKKMEEATPAELEQVPGIGRRLAAKIAEHLKK